MIPVRELERRMEDAKQLRAEYLRTFPWSRPFKLLWSYLTRSGSSSNEAIAS